MYGTASPNSDEDGSRDGIKKTMRTSEDSGDDQGDKGESPSGESPSFSQAEIKDMEQLIGEVVDPFYAKIFIYRTNFIQLTAFSTNIPFNVLKFLCQKSPMMKNAA